MMPPAPTQPSLAHAPTVSLLALLHHLARNIGRSRRTEPDETFWIVPDTSFGLPTETMAK